jgi:hypothetical protein
MYKTLCVAVLLLPTFALAQANSPATPVSPPIVAKGKLLNQTAPIPATTIFTPVQSGLYRLTVYGTITTSTCSGSVWTFTPEWTDDSGVLGNASGIVQSNGNCLGSFFSFDSGFSTGATITFEAKGATAITYNVAGSSDGSAYSLYYTLERLE